MEQLNIDIPLSNEMRKALLVFDIVASRNDVRIGASDSFICIYINYAEEVSQIFKVIVFE